MVTAAVVGCGRLIGVMSGGAEAVAGGAEALGRGDDALARGAEALAGELSSAGADEAAETGGAAAEAAGAAATTGDGNEAEEEAKGVLAGGAAANHSPHCLSAAVKAVKAATPRNSTV